MQKVPITFFVSALGDALARGDGYIMGAYGQNPRTGYLDLNVKEVKAAWKPTGYYYEQYTDPEQHAQALKWREQCVRVWDCNGLAEGIYQIETGTCINDKARGNYASWCDPKGEGTIPASRRVPGAAVFWGSKASKIEHVAYLFEPVEPGKPEGDWWMIEARGVMKGVIKTKLSQRKPQYWGWMTAYYDYAGAGSETPTGVLQRGEVGADVKAMQEALMGLGYDLGKWGADGEFGKATEKALIEFQTMAGLEADGKFGPSSLTALKAALDRLDDAVTPPEPTYTITIHGVHQPEMEAMRERWPDCEVTEE